MNPLRTIPPFDGTSEDDYLDWRKQNACLYTVSGWDGSRPQPIHCVQECEAAEDYVYGQLIDAPSERPDHVSVQVKSPDGVVTRWDVRIHWEPSPMPKQVG